MATSDLQILGQTLDPNRIQGEMNAIRQSEIETKQRLNFMESMNKFNQELATNKGMAAVAKRRAEMFPNANRDPQEFVKYRRDVMDQTTVSSLVDQMQGLGVNKRLTSAISKIGETDPEEAIDLMSSVLRGRITSEFSQLPNELQVQADNIGTIEQGQELLRSQLAQDLTPEQFKALSSRVFASADRAQVAAGTGGKSKPIPSWLQDLALNVRDEKGLRAKLSEADRRLAAVGQTMDPGVREDFIKAMRSSPTFLRGDIDRTEELRIKTERIAGLNSIISDAFTTLGIQSTPTLQEKVDYINKEAPIETLEELGYKTRAEAVAELKTDQEQLATEGAKSEEAAIAAAQTIEDLQAAGVDVGPERTREVRERADFNNLVTIVDAEDAALSPTGSTEDLMVAMTAKGPMIAATGPEGGFVGIQKSSPSARPVMYMLTKDPDNPKILVASKLADASKLMQSAEDLMTRLKRDGMDPNRTMREKITALNSILGSATAMEDSMINRFLQTIGITQPKGTPQETRKAMVAIRERMMTAADNATFSKGKPLEKAAQLYIILTKARMEMQDLKRMNRAKP